MKIHLSSTRDPIWQQTMNLMENIHSEIQNHIKLRTKMNTHLTNLEVRWALQEVRQINTSIEIYVMC